MQRTGRMGRRGQGGFGTAGVSSLQFCPNPSWQSAPRQDTGAGGTPRLQGTPHPSKAQSPVSFLLFQSSQADHSQHPWHVKTHSCKAALPNGDSRLRAHLSSARSCLSHLCVLTRACDSSGEFSAGSGDRNECRNLAKENQGSGVVPVPGNGQRMSKVTLEDMVKDSGGIRSEVGLYDLGGLFQVNDSMDPGKEPQ